MGLRAQTEAANCGVGCHFAHAGQPGSNVKDNRFFLPHLVWALDTIFYIGLVVVALITHAANIRKRDRLRGSRPIVLVGSGETASMLEQRIESDPASDMKIVARFGQSWSKEPTHPVHGLADFVKQEHIQSVWIAVPWEEKQLLEASLAELRESVVDVNVVPDLSSVPFTKPRYQRLGGVAGHQSRRYSDGWCRTASEACNGLGGGFPVDDCFFATFTAHCGDYLAD